MLVDGYKMDNKNVRKDGSIEIADDDLINVTGGKNNFGNNGNGNNNRKGNDEKPGPENLCK